MTWLIAVGIGLVAKVSRETKKQTALWLGGLLLFYGGLIAWLWLEAGAKAFASGEAGLVGWFVLGLFLFFIAELIPVVTESMSGLRFAAQALGAIAFSLGFDVFQPDAYSYVPGAILGALVLIVAVQAFLTFSAREKTTKSKLILAIYIPAIALMLYAATAKTIDRGWALPWAYLAISGALLFAAGQLWMGWELLIKKRAAAPWVHAAAINAGQLMMVVAAFFVYKEFL